MQLQLQRRLTATAGILLRSAPDTRILTSEDLGKKEEKSQIVDGLRRVE